MSAGDIAERLAGIAEELADMALETLREAAASSSDSGDPDPALVAEERRLTRARRAVEKAAALLRGRAGADEES